MKAEIATHERARFVRHFWESQRQRIIDDLVKPQWGGTHDKAFNYKAAVKCADNFIETMIFADMLPESVEKQLAAVAQRKEHRGSNAKDARSNRASRARRMGR